VTVFIDSDALDNFSRILGIGGGGGKTLLDNGNLSQVVDLAPVIRRSRTLGPSTGWLFALMLNEHAGAGELTSSANPFAAGDLAAAPYPTAIRQEWDFWLMQATVRRTAGTGTLDGAVLSIVPNIAQGGFGVDDNDNPTLIAHGMPVARWTGFDTGTGLNVGIAGDGGAMVKIGLRMARGSTLNFVSDVAGAAADVACLLTCGLFVGGLGQDIAQ